MPQLGVIIVRSWRTQAPVPVCPACGRPAATADCAACGAEVYPQSQENFPATAWAEIREHLVARLFIDEDWLVDEADALVWWPWFLKQSVAVTGRETFEQAGRLNTALRVTASTDILRVEDGERGLQVVEQANIGLPYGAFILNEDVVTATVSVMLSPFARGLLVALHEAALIQTTLAHQLAYEYANEPGIVVLASEHPRSGMREKPDDLLDIYGRDQLGVDQADDFPEKLAAARPVYRKSLLDYGFQAGHSADDVDFFNTDQLDIAVGRWEDTPLEQRFGVGLVVLVRFTNAGSQTPPVAVNAMNGMLSKIEDVSQLGPVLGGEREEALGLHLRCYLGYGYLAGVGGTAPPDALGIEIVNAVLHCARAVRGLLRSVA